MSEVGTPCPVARVSAPACAPRARDESGDYTANGPASAGGVGDGGRGGMCRSAPRQNRPAARG